MWAAVGSILFLALFFTHHTAIVLPVALVAAVLAGNGWRIPKSRIDLSLIFASLSAVVLYAYRVTVLPADFVSSFLRQAQQLPLSAMAFSIAIVALALSPLSAAALGKRTKTWPYVLGWVFVFSTICVVIGPGFFEINSAYPMRITALPLSCIIALSAALLFAPLEKIGFWKSAEASAPVLAILSLSLFFAAARDLSFTTEWKVPVSALNPYLEKPGCHLTDFDTTGTNNLFTATLLQKTTSPKVLVMREDMCLSLDFAHICSSFGGANFRDKCVPPDHILNGRFRYSHLEK